jgi:hypothetical protein
LTRKPGRGTMSMKPVDFIDLLEVRRLMRILKKTECAVRAMADPSADLDEGPRGIQGISAEESVPVRQNRNRKVWSGMVSAGLTFFERKVYIVCRVSR